MIERISSEKKNKSALNNSLKKAINRERELQKKFDINIEESKDGSSSDEEVKNPKVRDDFKRQKSI